MRVSTAIRHVLRTSYTYCDLRRLMDNVSIMDPWDHSVSRARIVAGAEHCRASPPLINSTRPQRAMGKYLSAGWREVEW